MPTEQPRQTGRRPDGTEPTRLNPSEYVRTSVTHRGKTFDAWWVCTPNGLLGRLSMPEDSPHHHEVEEHEDGSISVLPRPNNSNSIRVDGWPFGVGRRAEGEPLKSWHGYIRRGVFEST